MRSHFERLFGDAYKHLLWGLLGGPMGRAPDGDEQFQDLIEIGWRMLLPYGNGYFGFSVVPMVQTTDLLRYQELGGRDRTVSRGIAEYFVLLLGTFPPLLQHVLPQLGEVAFRPRLLGMFQPMVRRYAGRAAQRLRMADGVGGKSRAVLVEEFEAVLEDAIRAYDFTYGKTVGADGVAGQLGTSANPEARDRMGEALAHLGLDVSVYDLTPVNVVRYVQVRFDDHLRTHYPVPDRSASRQRPLDEPLGSRGGDVLADRLQGPAHLVPGADDEPDEAADWMGGSGLAVPDVVACTVGGMRYRYVDEMARLAGVTTYQLRRWDAEGSLPALWLGDLDPSRQGTPCADWRVYSDTPETVAAISELAGRKAQRRTGMSGDEVTRAGAARVLGVSAKTLQRWESAGVAKPIRRGNAVIYTEDELRRLALRSPRLRP